MEGLFLHIPKTAGNALLTTLNDVPVFALPHGTLARSKAVTKSRVEWIEDPWDNMFKFSFVRNPWDRMVSMYYHAAKRDTTRWDLERCYEDFRDWLCYDGAKLLLTTTAGVALCDWAGCSGQLDFIGQYEYLDRDLVVVAEQLGSKATTLMVSNPGRNRPAERAWQPYYDLHTRTLIAAMCSWEINTFRYHFDDEPTPAPIERPLLTNHLPQV